MQNRKPSSRVSKKPAKKPAKKVSKKTTRSTSKKLSAESGSSSSKAPSKRASKQNPARKGKGPILVPLDFSAHSEAALEHAVVLADCLQAPIAVLHVVHDPGDAPGYYQVKGRKKQLRRLEDVAREMLDTFMDNFIKRHAGHAALKESERLLVTGLPVTRILEIAEKLQPRMVVMGSAGRTGLSRFLLGSKAEQLARVCPFSVTIVKLPANKR